jgi:protein-ribulosamine 3-kinase
MPLAPTSVPSTSIPTSRIPESRKKSAVVKLSLGNYHSVMRLQSLATAIGETLGVTLRAQPTGRVHGGSINECYRWDSDDGPLFVKVAPARSRGMLEAEAVGLEALRSANAVRVPRVLGVNGHKATSTDGGVVIGTDAGADAAIGSGALEGSDAAAAWLALEFIQTGTASAASDTILGEQLALQHRATNASFGWHRDNTIGSTPQLNTWSDNWSTFWRDRRLGYQLRLAGENGHGGRLQARGATLLGSLDSFLAASYRPAPSLLHGDLWAGNRLTDEQGQPVIFDPAVYYGDREADLAMTRLFGGFSPRFYAAYEAAWPLDAGASVRADLYNLYHVLNHLNLFGEGYLGQSIALIDKVLAESGH